MKLKTPLSEDDVRSLRCGDKVELSGTLVTARDAAHKYLIEGGASPCDLNVIYHCGPIVKDNTVLSAGPTTSIREEPYEAWVISKFGVRAVIGKGGMGDKTLKALKDYGCVYLSAIGGGGALVAKSIRKVKAVHMLEELGSPEAFWELEVEDLPLFVSMDSHGLSIHEKIKTQSHYRLGELVR